MTNTFIHCKVCRANKASTEFYSGKTTCKDCTREASNKRYHDKKKEEGKEVVFDDLEDFKTKYEKHLAEKGTRFAVLTRSMFKTDEDFTAAKQMQKDNRKGTTKKCRQRPEARERANEQARTAYHNKTAEQKLEKSRAGDINKKKRKRSTPSGFCWCEYGGHRAPEADFYYDPKEDLGLITFSGKSGKRATCVKHYLQARETQQRYRRTEKAAEKSRMLERKDHVKAKRKKWRQDNRAHYNKVRRAYFKRYPEMAKKRNLKHKEYIMIPANMRRMRVANAKNEAKKRGLTFSLSTQKTEEILSTCATCTYCGAAPATGKLLSIDRIDSSKGYLDDNVVACCLPCNMARGGMSQDDFVRGSRNIVRYQETGAATKTPIPYYVGSMALRRGRSFKQCHDDAGRRKSTKDLQFELDKKTHTQLVRGPCYLCGVKSGLLGIDRKDSSLGYTVANSFGCCPCCNMMKRRSSFEEFVARCKRISDRF